MEIFYPFYPGLESVSPATYYMVQELQARTNQERLGDDRLVIFARIKCLVEKFGDCILIECFIKQKMIKKIKDKMFSLNFCFVTK